MKALIAVAIGVLCAAQVPAQTRSFEVASIKPNHSGEHRVSFGMAPGGRLNAGNVTVRMLITMAYGIRDHQLTGAPAWVDSEHFDIVAKAEGPGTQEDMRLMVQALLADRFKLTLRRESKELPVYALVVGKSGSKLEEVKADAPGVDGTPRPPMDSGRGGGRGGVRMMRIGRGDITAQVDMASLANQLSTIVGRHVIDKTGLSATYDVHLKWTPEPGEGAMPGMPVGGPMEGGGPPPPDASGPSLFTALQEQLGLRLESQKGPVEVFIIERVEKPSEN